MILHLTSAHPDPLERRGHYAWIGSSKDGKCNGGLTGPRPKLPMGKCVKFRPITCNVTVFLGEYPHDVDCVDTFVDEHCKQDNGSGFVKDKKKEQCFAEDPLPGFGSVKATTCVDDIGSQ